jgi:AcrR family transcriptional regulator
VEELHQGGNAALTIEAIARRSGVRSTTIYRRWHTAEGLLVDLLINMSATAIPVPDTGRLDSDLQALARSIAALYAAADRAAAIAARAGALRRSTAL